MVFIAEVGLGFWDRVLGEGRYGFVNVRRRGQWHGKLVKPLADLMQKCIGMFLHETIMICLNMYMISLKSRNQKMVRCFCEAHVPASGIKYRWDKND